jgi:hypothetical protein
MGKKIFAAAALIGLVFCHDAIADDRAKPWAAVRSTFAAAIPHHATMRPANARRVKRLRPVGTAGEGGQGRGAPPGAGYCWYYVDRSSRAPGFWDLCRGR